MTAARNSRVLRTIPLLLIVVLFCPLTYGKVIYPNDDATGANNGTSWTDEWNRLLDSLADAVSTPSVHSLVSLSIKPSSCFLGIDLGFIT